MGDNKEFIDNLKAKKEALEAQVAALQKEIRQLQNALVSLGEDDSYVEWTKDALVCIGQAGRFVKTAEVLNCLFYDYPEELEDEKRKRNYMVALSIALNKMVQTGRLRKAVVTGVRGHYYGLPAWTDELGTPLPEYADQALKEALLKPMTRTF
jgi:hypothetical protein